MNPHYVFGSHESGAYLTPLEKKRQRLVHVKTKLKGKHSPGESGVDNTFSMSHILTDDEYNFMRKKGAY